ncbi:TonB-dependent receptor [Hyphococcus flavus]|uniref:TonB-dependent receptor n=1 Tax=Hyphococcus flavus TaxID=1866326 RepID=A0AAE9ZB44_9PROT|nr:TonB-dependent receptor [Hyphococcus flavus]WDI31253.1 TonB-dependent receptor [Hyphococcus flavus]
MKPSFSFKSVLALSTMLISPTVANAQDEGLSIQPTISDQIIVRGQNIPDPQRATSQVATFLSADDLERTGDDNAAEALKRLSGLSVVSGKFAFVRGLGDRYSSARLNGSVLPSTEPLRRAVPLDLFPSDVLGGATVQKTYSPNYPGEFGGGIIDLQTLRDPGEPFLNVKVGTGLNTVTTGRNGIFVNGGDRDYLGYDDGTRSLSGTALGDIIDSQTRLSDLSTAEIEAAGEGLTNSPLTVIQEGTLGPDFEASINGGGSFDLNQDLTFGVVGTVGFDSGWSREISTRQAIVNSGLQQDFRTRETNYEATVNGLLSFSLEWFGNSVAATGLYIHSTNKQAQIDQGFSAGAPGLTENFVHVESSSFIERELVMGQLAGEHQFTDEFEVNWRGAIAQAKRESPYEQSLTRLLDPVTSLTPGSGFTHADFLGAEVTAQGFSAYRPISFSALDDDTYSGGVDLIYFVPLSGPRELEISIGAEYSENDRIYELAAFQFAGGNSLSPEAQIARPDFLFSPDNIGPAPQFNLVDLGLTGDSSYEADLTTIGAYAQIDAELIPTFRTTVGVRYEDGEQSVTTFDRIGNQSGFDAAIDNNYWLPSATVTWNFTDDMQLRAGYSHTIARPQFRELAPSLFFDPDSDRAYRGNAFLVDSEFRNYDLRYEFYLGRNQFLTLAGFYKTIDNPIEEFITATSADSFETRFINTPKAELLGGEFEYRTRFGIGWNDWTDRRDWLFAVNYTYTKSEIKVDAGDMIVDPVNQATRTEIDATQFGFDGAALQGTPEHIFNAQFGWEGDDDQLTVLVGWVDERILQRGNLTQGVPDIIENPGVQLDLVYRQNVEIANTDFTIGLSARNLLGTQHEEYQLSNATMSGRTEFLTYDRGRSLSASLTAKF